MAAAAGDRRITIQVGADTADLVQFLRTIAKHAEACADELEMGTPAAGAPAPSADHVGHLQEGHHPA